MAADICFFSSFFFIPSSVVRVPSLVAGLDSIVTDRLLQKPVGESAWESWVLNLPLGEVEGAELQPAKGPHSLTPQLAASNSSAICSIFVTLFRLRAVPTVSSFLSKDDHCSFDRPAPLGK